MLAKVLGEKELMEIDVQGIKDDESLFHELVNRKAILLADWSGEDKEGMSVKIKKVCYTIFSTVGCNQC